MIHIAFLLFPNVTQLDLTGPAQVLSRLGDAKIDLVAKTRDPVPTDAGSTCCRPRPLPMSPMSTFCASPADSARLLRWRMRRRSTGSAGSVARRHG